MVLLLHWQVMLNKFVRLAGDILLQPLYVPYINMLASLSTSETAALFCFRLLASDGNVSHINSCAVTWDHFFSSIKQYYLSLRQHPDATGMCKFYLPSWENIEAAQKKWEGCFIKLIRLIILNFIWSKFEKRRSELIDCSTEPDDLYLKSRLAKWYVFHTL